MTLHIRSTRIIFDLNIDRVRHDCDRIASLARTLMMGKKFIENYEDFDLRRSEQNLRDAADKIKAIREEIEGRAVMAEAAE